MSLIVSLVCLHFQITPASCQSRPIELSIPTLCVLRITATLSASLNIHSSVYLCLPHQPARPTAWITTIPLDFFLLLIPVHTCLLAIDPRLFLYLLTPFKQLLWSAIGSSCLTPFYSSLPGMPIIVDGIYLVTYKHVFMTPTHFSQPLLEPYNSKVLIPAINEKNLTVQRSIIKSDIWYIIKPHSLEIYYQSLHSWNVLSNITLDFT